MKFHLPPVVRSVILALFLTAVVHLSSAMAGGNQQGPQPDIIGLPPLGVCDSLGGAGTRYISGINCRVMRVDGHPRTYIVYVPPAGLLDPAPVVFMFHGSSGTGARHFKISGWKETADEEGLIAVFPTGLSYCKIGAPCENGGQGGWITKWHDYSLELDPDLNLAVRPPADDVRFTRRMIADLNAAETGLHVDPDRIYATGFSNGAGFTARLAVELADQLAAVAYVAGGLTAEAGEIPSPIADVPIYAAFGTNDDRILDRLADPGIETVPLAPADLFAIPEIREGYIRPHLDGFDHTYDPGSFVPYLSYRAETYTLFGWRSASGDEAGHIFRLAVLSGLGHIYPNGCDSSGINPNNTHCFRASRHFWRFFERHPGSHPESGFVDNWTRDTRADLPQAAYLPVLMQ